MNTEPFEPIPAAPAAAVHRDAPPPKSAVGAWALSLVVPGLGQMYLGKWKRGIFTLGFLSSAIAGAMAVHGSGVQSDSADLLTGLCIKVGMALWGFAGFDAFHTAVEMDTGVDAIMERNPRVAFLLNLVTNGFGYFYNRETTLGFITFWGMRVLGKAAQGAGRMEAMAFELLFVVAALHVWRRLANLRTRRVKLAGLTRKPRTRMPAWLVAVFPVVLTALYVAICFADELLPEEPAAAAVEDAADGYDVERMKAEFQRLEAEATADAALPLDELLKHNDAERALDALSRRIRQKEDSEGQAKLTPLEGEFLMVMDFLWPASGDDWVESYFMEEGARSVPLTTGALRSFGLHKHALLLERAADLEARAAAKNGPEVPAAAWAEVNQALRALGDPHPAVLDYVRTHRQGLALSAPVKD